MYNDQKFSPTVAGISFANKMSTVDKTLLRFSMWKTTLKISIYPIIENGADDDKVSFDFSNGVSIYLVPAKALMFAHILEDYKENRSQTDIGVAAGQGLITVASPKAFGKDPKDTGTIICIRRVNKNGQVESSYCYETRKDAYESIIGFDDKTGSFKQEKTKFNDLELDMIIRQLIDYACAMNNAYAFATLNQAYPYYDKMASKLGVDLSANNGYGGNYRNQSYFSNNNNGQGFGQSSQPEQQVTNNELMDIMNN